MQRPKIKARLDTVQTQFTKRDRRQREKKKTENVRRAYYRSILQGMFLSKFASLFDSKRIHTIYLLIQKKSNPEPNQTQKQS